LISNEDHSPGSLPAAGAAPAGTVSPGADPAPRAAAGPGPADDRAPGPRGSDQPLCAAYDVALLDLDGVIYLGGKAIPGAPDALAQAARAGMRAAFVTNNASRSPSRIAAQLAGLGVPATAADVVTSAQAAARLLAERLPAGARVLVAGGTGLRIALHEQNLRPVSAAAEHPAAVVQGYSPDLSYALLAEAALAIRAGAWYVATNADGTLPTPRGPQPGNGSIIELLVTATGVRPVVAGKPEPPLHAESVRRTGARHPLVVGDRLDTDIEGAVRGHADSLLVLTGVSTPADAILAPPQCRPTYLARDLGGLLTSHPEVTRADGGGWSCGGWTARLAPDGGKLGRSGSGDPVDALRALCRAAWTADAPVTRDVAAAALSGLDLPS
jgi:HAD superfamily hydrolase (TIGR01450 family)